MNRAATAQRRLGVFARHGLHVHAYKHYCLATCYICRYSSGHCIKGALDNDLVTVCIGWRLYHNKMLQFHALVDRCCYNFQGVLGSTKIGNVTIYVLQRCMRHKRHGSCGTGTHCALRPPRHTWHGMPVARTHVVPWYDL